MKRNRPPLDPSTFLTWAIPFWFWLIVAVLAAIYAPGWLCVIVGMIFAEAL